ncbi:serine/threonine-protein kinase HipA [Ruminococcaceae bacterium YRB3002]|nr:serine/threonine-protein kinase HipA [Ruminococcaceae bacterium YRB3002]
MISSVEVRLWGTRIGQLYLDPGNTSGQIALYEYDKDFIRSGIEVSPLMMPLSRRIYAFPGLPYESFKGLPGLIADSLPDRFGNKVLDSWLISQGRSPDSISSLERLCYIGTRGMGALEYLPSTGPGFSGDLVDITEMTRFASEVLDERSNASVRSDSAGYSQLMETGTSAGGARAKALIAWNEDTGEIRSGQIALGQGFRYWILKFDNVAGNGDHGLTDDKQYSRIEYAYYLMAKDIGIDMCECRLLERDGMCHFLTERFDRVNNRKVHMQSLAAIAHADYNSPGIMSYESYADIAKRLGIGQNGIRQIFTRMVFAVAGMNCDDHVKNFAFLMDRNGKWDISPAYDLTYAFSPGNRWLSGHQMTVNGKTAGITEQDLLSCGRYMGLGPEYCRRAIRHVNSIVSDWMTYAERSGLTEERAISVAGGIEKAGIVRIRR